MLKTNQQRYDCDKSFNEMVEKEMKKNQGVKMRILFTALISLSLLTGCSGRSSQPHWSRTMTDADAEDLETAKAACSEQAEDKFPVKNEVAQRTVYNTHYEVCRDCKKGSDKPDYEFVNKPEIQSYALDVNLKSRQYFFHQCMIKRGWKKN